MFVIVPLRIVVPCSLITWPTYSISVVPNWHFLGFECYFIFLETFEDGF